MTVALSGSITQLSPGIQFAFTIDGFVNPSSTLPSNAIVFYAYDSALNEINKYTTGTPIKVRKKSFVS